ncbi:hypothetical protein BH11MYX1_BH11MYX1_32450 [soil metagenome]
MALNTFSIVVGAVSIAVLSAFGGSARAQGAWVNDPKSLTANLQYQYVPSSSVVLSPTESQNDRPTVNHLVTLGLEYVLVENLALNLEVPFAAIKYSGDPVHAQHLPKGKWDDGKFHYTPEDLRFGVRYQVLDEPILAVTPYAAVSLPMTNYETIGFATGGRNLRAAHFGVAFGRTFTPYLPRLFFQAGYELTLAQSFDANADTKKIGQSRSDVDATVGYAFLDGDLVVDLAANFRAQHDGVEFTDFPKKNADGTPKVPFDDQLFHDAILKEQYTFFGGDVSYALTTKFSVDLSVRFFYQGYNTRDQSLYGLNFSWRAL